jgi:hypothetical protein
MLENLNISEMDPQSIALTRIFLKDSEEIFQKAASESEGSVKQEFLGYARDVQNALHRIQFDLTRRSIGQQAAQAAIDRTNRLNRTTGPITELGIRSQFEVLQQNAYNYVALNTPGNFGLHLEQDRSEMLNKLRTKFSQHLGPLAPVGFQLHQGNQRMQRILNYLKGMEKSNPYDDIQFKRAVKELRKDINHKSASTDHSKNTAKTKVLDTDLSMTNCVVRITKHTTHKGLEIPYSMSCTIGPSNSSYKADIPGLTGGSGAPMTKHLKDYLDSFNDPSVFDAIMYCRSWLFDLVNIPKQTITSSVKSGNKFYSTSIMRWEYIMSNAHVSIGGYSLFHIVAKGLQTGVNPFHTN